MTPRQARAARAMLGFDMKAVCAQAGVGKRTLTEFEAGKRALSDATESKISAFYISKGLTFATPEDGEGVSFANPPQNPSGEVDEIRAKAEYIDVLNANEAVASILSAMAIHKALAEKATISRSIIQTALKNSGLSQKELALTLGCTASFVNAVAAGKKSLPISYSGAIQKFFVSENLNVDNALRKEKVIKKIISQVSDLHDLQLAAWRSMQQPS